VERPPSAAISILIVYAIFMRRQLATWSMEHRCPASMLVVAIIKAPAQIKK
jgi:hypothetical protein